MEIGRRHPEATLWAMAGFLLATAAANAVWPEFFFSKSSVPWVWAAAVTLSAALTAAAGRIRRLRGLHRARAAALVRKAAADRVPAPHAGEVEIARSARFVARLVRHADADLSEIGPDFTPASLRRLERILPEILEEASDEIEARVRLGVVGTYLGETLARERGGRWHFRSDPAKRQFSYQVSEVRFGDKTFDPYGAAADWLTGGRRLREILGELDPKGARDGK